MSSESTFTVSNFVAPWNPLFHEGQLGCECAREVVRLIRPRTHEHDSRAQAATLIEERGVERDAARFCRR